VWWQEPLVVFAYRKPWGPPVEELPTVSVLEAFVSRRSQREPPIVPRDVYAPTFRRVWRYRTTWLPPERVGEFRHDVEVVLPYFESEGLDTAVDELRRVIQLCSDAQQRGLGIAISGP
jgi:hypothetical protein